MTWLRTWYLWKRLFATWVQLHFVYFTFWVHFRQAKHFIKLKEKCVSTPNLTSKRYLRLYIYNKFRFNVILLSQTDEINIGVCVLFWWFGLPSWTWKFILCCNLMGFLIITFLLQTGLLCNRIRKMQLYWFENNPLTNERMNEWSNNEREYWITVR